MLNIIKHQFGYRERENQENITKEINQNKEMKRDEEGLKDWETEEGKTLSIRREEKKGGRAKLKELTTGFSKKDEIYESCDSQI